MIRRLCLYQPMSEDEARAATAWAEKLGDQNLTLSYRPSPVPMRLLLFDRVNQPGKKRRDRSRIMERVLDPESAPMAALRAAMASGEIVFNIRTAANDPSIAYSWTDAVFTIAFPEGQAVAWFRRVTGGIAPGIARECIDSSARDRTDRYEICQAARFLFFKKPPRDIAEHERVVIGFARDLLADLPPL